MAEASGSEKQFKCLVCLDVLKDTVILPCGHNYCMSCITEFWNQNSSYSCPQCRKTYSSKPVPGKKITLPDLVKQLKKIRMQTDVPAACSAAPGDVECDICTGRKNKAVKFCLVCMESYCQIHFERHEEFHSEKRHKVTNAIGQLQQMICHQHKRILEVFCCTDQQYVCTLCAMDKHKGHNTVSAAAKQKENERNRNETQRKVQEKIQWRQKRLQELKDSVQIQKHSAQTAAKEIERTFTELIHSIERSCSEVTQQIRDQETASVSQAEGLMERLEQEIDDLKRTDAELEQLSHIDCCDYMYFHQSPCSLSTPPETADNIAVNYVFSFDGVREFICQLRQKMEDFCKEELKKMSVTHSNIVPKTREEFRLYSHQLTLDPNTAHKHLSLSEENRMATFADEPQLYPEHPDRFDKCFQVLGKEGVSGRCYWEVEWKNSAYISMSYKSIGRKGHSKEFRFGCNDQSWSLFCSPLCFSFWHNSTVVELPVPFSSSRIGVYVDHTAGTLSFYSVFDKMRLIYRVRTTFTEPLYPGFVVSYGSSVKLC